MNVCEALIASLADNGVQYIFGVPGDAINELIEAIRKQDRIKFIHVMHEEAGAFAASAQAKLSGKLAVCAGTAGPGAIHLLNGLYDAKMDHAPVLAITGQVDTNVMGTGYQQEVNLHALFSDVTVYNQTIVDAAQVPEVVYLACEAAMARKSVAHLSIPANISKQKVSSYEKKVQALPKDSVVLPPPSELRKAAELILTSQKPCILAGIGARNAVPELLLFAERIGAPIIKALRGKDLLPDAHPMTLGGIGLLGTEPAVNAIKQCDVLLVAGSDFPYSEFYPQGTPVIQIDINAQQLGRRTPVKQALCGDVKHTLDALMPLVHEKRDQSFLNECRMHMKKWLEKQDETEHSRDEPLHPQTLARTIADLAPENAIICCDTGAVTVWGARDFRIKQGQRFTLSGGLASMAFGLPAAIGAQLLYPERQVIALCGDGGFAMLMCDFATAVKYKLPVKIFIFNNSKLGLIQIEEEARAGNPEHETGLHNPDYAAYAVACGGEGYTVKTYRDLEPTIGLALSSAKPCVVNVFVNPEEIPWPPEIEFNEAFHYLTARVKEFFSGKS